MATNLTAHELGPGTSRYGRRVVAARLLMLWVFLVSVYFLWEAFRYRGLYALLAEWQFEQLGHYLPVLTFALLVLLFGSPAAWLLKKRRRADRRDLPNRTGRRAAVHTALNLRQVLFGFAGGLGAAALLTLLYTLTLPTMSLPRQQVTVGEPDSIAPNLEPTMLRGEIIWTRTAAMAQDLMVSERGVRFAPVIAPGDKGRKLRYFIELPPATPLAPVLKEPVSTRSGMLTRNSLPGSITRLYRYAGYEVEPPYYVLYTSERTIRAPFYLTAAQLALAAVIAFLVGLLQHRHVRKLTEPDKDS